jgi:hypothetical protein
LRNHRGGYALVRTKQPILVEEILGRRTAWRMPMPRPV